MCDVKISRLMYDLPLSVIGSDFDISQGIYFYERNFAYAKLRENKTLPKISELIIEPVHEISNNVVCAISKASDQPAHTRSLIRAFPGRLSIL